MNEVLQWALIIIGLSIAPVIVTLINYYAKKKKIKAETEKINLENKIEILKQIVILEEEIKNKEKITESDQKKLDSLEMIKKEFKQSFTEKGEEKAKLTEKRENNEEKTKKSRVKSKNIQ